MMGLLDDFLGAPGSDRDAQMSGLAQGLLSARGGRGIAAGLQGMENAKTEGLRKKLLQSQIDETTAQAEERKAKALQQAALIEAAKRRQAALPGLWGDGPPAAPQAMGPAPTAPQFDPMQPPQAQAPQGGGGVQQINWKAALAAGYKPEEIMAMAALPNAGRAEVARTIKGMGANNREQEFQVDKFGNKIGDGFDQYRAPIQVNQGNKTTFADPYSLQPQANFQTFQSPDSVATNATTQRGQNMVDARSRELNAASKEQKPQLVEGQWVMPPSAQNPTGLALPVKDFQGKDKALTEDQGKATGWLIQADNAWKNMQGAMAKNPSAARPGFTDALSAIPSMGLTTGAANMMRGDERQKFMQGSSSLSEALLRAATGAGVNKDEAAQKIKELTPSIGDSDAVVKQKMDAIPLYIESLKVRAGPGAPKAEMVGNGKKSAMSGGWSAVEVK